MTQVTDDIDKRLKWTLPTGKGLGCLNKAKKVAEKYSPKNNKTPDYVQQLFSTFTLNNSKDESKIISQLRLAGVKWPDNPHIAGAKLTFELQPTGDNRLGIDPPVLLRSTQGTSSRFLTDAVRRFIQPRPLPVHFRGFKTSGQTRCRDANLLDEFKTFKDGNIDVNQSQLQKKLPSPWKNKSPSLASLRLNLEARNLRYNPSLHDLEDFFSYSS